VKDGSVPTLLDNKSPTHDTSKQQRCFSFHKERETQKT